MSDNKSMTDKDTSQAKYSITYKNIHYTFDLKEENETTQKFAVYRYSDLMFFVVLSRSSEENELEQLESVLFDYLDEYCGIIR